MLGPVFRTSTAPEDIPVSETALTTPYQPYQKLPGAPADNLPNGAYGPVVPNLPSVWEDARTVFPRIDGSTNLLDGPPPDFATATAGDFLGWHSSYQVEYLATDTSSARYPDAPSLRDELQVTVDSVEYDIYYKDFGGGDLYLLSQAKDRVYRLNTIMYADIARMPLADQIALAALPEFRALISEPMNLLPLGTDTVENARADMQALVQSYVDGILAEVPDALETERDRFLGEPASRAELYHFLFTEQLELYKLRLDGMALFNPDQIVQDLEAIKSRFDRYQKYTAYPAENPVYDPGDPSAGQFTALADNVNASDGGASVTGGAGVFLRVESRFYELALQKAFITHTGTNLTFSQIVAKGYDTANTAFVDYKTLFDNANAGVEINTDPQVLAYRGIALDGPNLLFLLQNMNSQEAEAEAEGKTEELNQINKLLQDYSLMQKILNDTLSEFKPAASTDEEDDKEPEQLTLLNVVSTSQLNTADHPFGYRVASMFDTSATAANSGHPFEVERGIFRPTETIAADNSTTLTAHTRTVWDAMAINLGDTTKMISQDSQIRMDEINQLNKAKNRTFDLGSNSLNKLTEILRNIVAT